MEGKIDKTHFPTDLSRLKIIYSFNENWSIFHENTFIHDYISHKEIIGVNFRRWIWLFKQTNFRWRRPSLQIINQAFCYLIKTTNNFFLYVLTFSLSLPPVVVPIEMKCTTSQPSQMTIVNENCSNNSSNNRPASIAGIVDGTGIMTQINPSPIIQQQTMTPMNVSSPPEHHHKSPVTTISTGSTSTISCGSCLQPICDRYIMKVVDTRYHERCLQCASCCCNLMNTCYQRDNKLYCRIDYERWVFEERK